MVVSLNAIDETTRKGVWIDSQILSQMLGVPVVELVTIKDIGTPQLKKALVEARKGEQSIQYGGLIETGISCIESKFPEEIIFKRKLATLLLQEDPYLPFYLKKVLGETKIKELKEEVQKVKHLHRGNLSRLINKKRSQWVDAIIDNCVKRHRLDLGGFSQAAARLSRHPVFGIPILLVVIAIMYLLVVNVANVIAGWMDATLWAPIEQRINVLVPQPFWNDFLIGDYGVLSLGLANAFSHRASYLVSFLSGV